MGQEWHDNIEASHTRGRHERRLAFANARVYIRSCRQQHPDNGRIPVPRGQRERFDAVARRQLRVRAGAQQVGHRVDIVQVHGPVQCGGAIGLAAVYVGALLQQHPRGWEILLLDGLDEPSFVCTRARRPGCQAQQAGSNDSDAAGPVSHQPSLITHDRLHPGDHASSATLPTAVVRHQAGPGNPDGDDQTLSAMLNYRVRIN